MSEQKESLIPPEFWKDKTVLIVDDEEELRVLAKRVFMRQNTGSILTAKNGTEAIKLIENNEIDLILTDWHMPEMEGPELIGWIRDQKEQPQPTIIIASGNEFVGLNELQLESEAKRLRVDLAFPKPYSIVELPLKAAQAILSHNSQRD